jgi:Fe-Mn family superoxide dismutase
MNTGLRLASSFSRSACARPCLRPRIKRNYHQLELLPYPIENGLGDFLPPAALKVVAIDYQAGLLQQLNEELRGALLRPSLPELSLMTSPTASEEPIRSVTQTVLDASPYQEKTLTFNYASLAINNDFFLRTLVRLQKF